jgi:hypothetical protein
VILVSLQNASFHMVHVYTINWFKKVQNINNYCSHAEQPTFNCHKRGGAYHGTRDLSVKGGTSERCYRTRRGRTDEQRYAIISPYFDRRIKMNGCEKNVQIKLTPKNFLLIIFNVVYIGAVAIIRQSDSPIVRQML